MKALGQMKLASGITYPTEFEVQAKGKIYYVVPVVKQAEMLHFGKSYGWYEGVIDVFADTAHTQKIGWGFLEMVRYGNIPIHSLSRILPRSPTGN